MGTDRLEALSDRVLAVAITLLVLGLQVPVPGRGSLASQLARAWPSFAAHLVSFLVIGIIWVNHHALLHNIAHIDRTAMFVNVLLLMSVTAIPFSTETLHHGVRDSHLAAAIYGLPVLGVRSVSLRCARGRPVAGCFTSPWRAAGRLLPCAVSLPGRSRSWPRSVRRS